MAACSRNVLNACAFVPSLPTRRWPIRSNAALRNEPLSQQKRNMADLTRRERLGVTPAMIEAFGPIIFDLSLNVQDRHGDPVRVLDFAKIEHQRAATGLSDREIAARLGLAVDQVTFIRVLLEQRRFKPERYYRLFQLGGGRRFRTER